MADMIDGQILEGMYSGIEEKIDEIKQELSLELEINSTQIETSLKDTLESMINEVRYITQQNSEIYDLNKADINALKEDLEKSMGGETVEKAVADLKAQMDELNKIISSLSDRTPQESAGGEDNGDKIGAAVDSVNARTQFEIESLKSELMDALAQLAVNGASSENTGAVSADNFDTAVGALYEKLDAQSNEVNGLKDDLASLKNELMDAMAQLAVNGASSEDTGAVSALYEKLDAQANEVGALKGNLDTLKEDVMGALKDLAAQSAKKDGAASTDSEKLNAAVSAVYGKIDAQASEVNGLKGEFDTLKDDLMGAMAQLAMAVTSGEDTEKETDKFNAAVGGFNQKLDAQANDVGGIKDELNALKDELMNAMAQLAVSVTPDESAQSANSEKLNAAVSAIYEKLNAQASDVSGLKEEMGALKEDLRNAVSQIASSEEKKNEGANGAQTENYGEELRAQMKSFNDEMRSEMASLKDELMNAMAQLAVSVTPDESAQNANSGKLEEEVLSLNQKMDTQAAEVGGLKNELLEAMAQIGMAVSTAPSSANDFMALKQEIDRNQNANEAMEAQFDRAIDSLIVRMQSEIDRLKSDLLGAIAAADGTSPKSSFRAESADSRENSEKIASAVNQLNNNLDTQMGALKDELMCAITQVGMAVFNAPDKNDFASFKEMIANNAVAPSASKASEAQINYDWLAEKLAQKVPVIDYDFMAKRVKELLSEQQVAAVKTDTAESVSAPKKTIAESDGEPFEIDYDLLAEKIAIIIPEVDYDELADRIANMIPQADENAIADKVASVIPQTDEDEIADKVADAIPLVDYDLIASKVAEKVLGDYEDAQDRDKSERERMDYDTLAEKLAQKVSSGDFFTTSNRIASVRDDAEEIDYDLLADKVAERLPETDYDELADRVAERVPQIDCDELARRIAEANGYADAADGEKAETAETAETPVSVDYDLLAEKVAEKMPSFDYDELASRLRMASAFVSSKASIDYDELAEHMKVTASDIPAPEMAVDYDLLAEVLAQKVPTVDYDEISERIRDVLGTGVGSEGVDYDRIAERIAATVPEVDYDLIAERVASVVGTADEEAIANKVASSVPAINYDLLADRVARMLENEFDVTVDETGISKIARSVSEEIDYSKVAEAVAETLKKEDFVKKVQTETEKEVKAAEEEAVIASAPQGFAPAYSYAPQPAYNYAPQNAQPAYNYAPQPNYNNFVQNTQPVQPAQPAQQPQPAPKFPFGNAPKKKEKIVKRTEAPSAKPAPILDEDEEENDQTTRFKRSFIARIIQSDEETKSYYSKLKNAILQYARTNSQVNWSNDRFSYAGETIAKIGVNGKSLCMYIALDPEEFATSVYHQKYEGDKKMYEKTPMMVKIKSEVGLKRALRLIPLLMEKLGAAAGEKKNVDYVAMYPFKTDDELLEAGLIKMQATAKTGFDF